MFPSQYLAKKAAEEEYAAIDPLSGGATLGGALIGGGAGKLVGATAGKRAAGALFARSRAGRMIGNMLDPQLEQTVNRFLDRSPAIANANKEAAVAYDALQRAQDRRAKLLKSQNGVFSRVRDFFFPGSTKARLQKATDDYFSAWGKANDTAINAKALRRQLFAERRAALSGERDSRLGRIGEKLKAKFGRLGGMGGAILGAALGGGALYAISNPGARAAFAKKLDA